MINFVYLKSFYVHYISILLKWLGKPIKSRLLFLRDQDAAVVIMKDYPTLIITSTGKDLLPVQDIMALAINKIISDGTGTTNFREAIQDVATKWGPQVAAMLDNGFKQHKTEIPKGKEDA